MACAPSSRQRRREKWDVLAVVQVAGRVGLSVRHDHGSQYVTVAFQEQLAFLGIESSPASSVLPKGMAASSG